MSEPRSRAPLEAELSWADVNAMRLARHHLLERAPASQLDRVVGDIVGAQAQVMSAAEMQIAVRVDCSVQDVRDALWKRKKLVKTWLMRGTLHVARAADLPLYTAATSKHWISVNRRWLKYIGISEDELWTIVDEIGDVLSRTPTTRQELIDRVGKGKPPRMLEWLRSGWGGMLKPAARNGKLCFGPNRGQSVTFVSPEAWLGSWKAVDPDSALPEVARRYLRLYGPANKQDFARWWGVWAGLGPAAWNALADELVTVSVEGSRAQMLRADIDNVPSGRRPLHVQLLPNFDPYLMGHVSRDHLFDAVHRWKVSRVAGWISPVILVNGRVIGVWSYTMAKKRLRVRLQPFETLAPRVVREAGARAEALARALDAKI